MGIWITLGVLTLLAMLPLGVHIGYDEGHVLLAGVAGLDAHVDAGGLETLCGADAAFNKLHMEEPPYKVDF